MFNETVSREGLTVTAEMLEAAGIHTGDAVDISVSEGAVTIRVLNEQERAAKFQAAKTKVFGQRRKVLEALAEGAA
jgi:hypothetical protein